MLSPFYRVIFHPPSLYRIFHQLYIDWFTIYSSLIVTQLLPSWFSSINFFNFSVTCQLLALLPPFQPRETLGVVD